VFKAVIIDQERGGGLDVARTADNQDSIEKDSVSIV